MARRYRSSWNQYLLWGGLAYLAWWWWKTPAPGTPATPVSGAAPSAQQSVSLIGL